MRSAVTFMNAKEVKQLRKLVQGQFGTDWLPDGAWYVSSQRKLYLVNNDVTRLDFSKLNVDTFGVYMGEMRDNWLRLSVDGSQLIGPHATRQVIALHDDQVEPWMQGEKLTLHDDQRACEDHAFVLVRRRDDFLGCGKRLGGELLNYVSKSRKVKTLIAGSDS